MLIWNFLLKMGPRLEDLKFKLNANDKVKVKAFDKYHFSAFVDLDVTVESTFEKVTTKDELKNEIRKQFFDENSDQSLNNLMESNKYDDLMQSLMDFVGYLGTMANIEDYEETINDYNIIIVDLMRKVPNTGKEARNFASMIHRMSKQYKNKSNPDVAKLSSDICEKASDEHLKSLQRDRYSKFMANDVVETLKDFSECPHLSSLPNLGMIETHDIFNMTVTPFPLLELPSITEEYTDYDDDQNTSKIISKYEFASKKMISICYLNAEALALVMENDTEIVGNEFFKLSATRKLGEIISDTNIISHDVRVLVSKDFLRYIDEDVSVLLCTSTENPFWWIKRSIATSVAMLKFIVRNEEVNEFEEPFTISFENTEKNLSWIPFHETATPRRPNDTAIHDRDYERMQIFRIDVIGQQGYVVEFLDLAANAIFNVYISDFVKPTLEEFAVKATLINEKNYSVYIPHERHFNSWHYLCILPNERVVGQRVAVKFRVYAMSCFSWEAENRSWVFSCGSTGTSSLARFDCICYHSSVLAGRITINHVREEKPTKFYEHVLELQTNWIIFISEAVAFFLYCMILVIISPLSGWDRERRIYCLSDVTDSSQYEYLLITKTGNGFTDGTTSHIVIKLYGEEAATEEHVLNFPDPDKMILQSNQEDWFFLATENYLGEIEKLEIWFDCIGLKPSWYCSEIEVFDLQENKYWWFNIRYRFEISTKEKYFYTAVPEQREGEKRSGKSCLKKVSMEGNHLWNIFR
ncbi:hypothetical protein JTB14_014087 [Gonioctena quinquepunctata]|nr:hypothetical protein JTB14_014087 [Gonioctena quinquepunctata]